MSAMAESDGDDAMVDEGALAPNDAGRRSFASTAIGAVERVMSFAVWPQELVVHVVGGEPGREGDDDAWAPLVASAARRGVGAVRIVVVGPGMADRPAARVGGGGGVAHASGFYDDWLAGPGAREPPPDVALLFHPGLWGYATWRASLRALLARGSPTVVTSYTPQEAELDALAVGAALLGEADADDDDKAAAAAEARLRWFWRPEANPHASPVVRPTATAPPGHVYRENHCWFGFRRS